MNSDKFGFVYLWFDRKHKRFYLGCHWGTFDDGYVCSSQWMLRAHERRPEDFKRRILKIITTNWKDLFAEEFRWLSMIRAHELRQRYYNLKVYKDNSWFCDPANKLTVGERISVSKTGKAIGPCPPAARENISRAKLEAFQKKRDAGEQIFTDEARARNSLAKLGTKHSPEHRAKISEGIRARDLATPRIGHAHTTESKRKNSQAHRGMKRSEETRKNIAASNSRDYMIVFMDDTTEKIRGLKEYSKTSGIPYVTLFNASRKQKAIPKYKIQEILLAA